MKLQVEQIPELGKLIRSISGKDANIQTEVLMNHYFLYDYDSSFLPQYERNMKILKNKLLSLKEEEE